MTAPLPYEKPTLFALSPGQTADGASSCVSGSKVSSTCTNGFMAQARCQTGNWNGPSSCSGGSSAYDWCINGSSAFGDNCSTGTYATGMVGCDGGEYAGGTAGCQGSGDSATGSCASPGSSVS